MTLTIDLPPALEERLQEESAREGLPAEEYARRVLEERLLPSGTNAATGNGVNEQRLRAFNEWVGSHAGYPALPLSDEAVSRESIYGDREDRQL
jgi:hypothetical protein